MRCDNELRGRVRELAGEGYDEFAVAYVAGVDVAYVLNVAPWVRRRSAQGVKFLQLNGKPFSWAKKYLEALGAT
jgi:hypothetical protein